MFKKRSSLTLVLVLVIVYAVKAWYHPHPVHSESHHSTPSTPSVTETQKTSSQITDQTDAITVARYLQAHQKLPAFYIRKGEARQQGWVASQGNLCQVLPGRVIGGDSFSNREHRLPVASGRKWNEADVNFNCGRRNSDRLLYSTDGLIYLTTDHYRSFKQVP